MARTGNKSSGKVNNTKGPCTICRTKEGPFFPVMSFTSSGKKRMIRSCTKCLTKV